MTNGIFPVKYSVKLFLYIIMSRERHDNTHNDYSIRHAAWMLTRNVALYPIKRPKDLLKSAGCALRVAEGAILIASGAFLAERVGLVNLNDLSSLRDKIASSVPFIPSEEDTASSVPENNNQTSTVSTKTEQPLQNSVDPFKMQDWCPLAGLGLQVAAKQIADVKSAGCIDEQKSVCEGQKPAVDEPCKPVLDKLIKNFKLPNAVIYEGKTLWMKDYLDERINKQDELNDSQIPKKVRVNIISMMKYASDGKIDEASKAYNEAGDAYSPIKDGQTLNPSPRDIIPALADSDETPTPTASPTTTATTTATATATITPRPTPTPSPSPTSTPDIPATATAEQDQIDTEVNRTLQEGRATQAAAQATNDEINRLKQEVDAATRRAENIHATLTAIPRATGTAQSVWSEQELKKVQATLTAAAEQTAQAGEKNSSPPTETPTPTPTSTIPDNHNLAFNQQNRQDVVFPQQGTIQIVRIRNGV